MISAAKLREVVGTLDVTCDALVGPIRVHCRREAVLLVRRACPGCDCTWTSVMCRPCADRAVEDFETRLARMWKSVGPDTSVGCPCCSEPWQVGTGLIKRWAL